LSALLIVTHSELADSAFATAWSSGFGSVELRPGEARLLTARNNHKDNQKQLVKRQSTV